MWHVPPRFLTISILRFLSLRCYSLSFTTYPTFFSNIASHVVYTRLVFRRGGCFVPARSQVQMAAISYSRDSAASVVVLSIHFTPRGLTFFIPSLLCFTRHLILAVRRHLSSNTSDLEITHLILSCLIPLQLLNLTMAPLSILRLCH
jgi:hypothetical protein